MDRGNRQSEGNRERESERERAEAHIGGWLMGLALSVLAGKHIYPYGGGVKVWQRSAERSLLDVITSDLISWELNRLLEMVWERTLLQDVKKRHRTVSKILRSEAKIFLKTILGAFCNRKKQNTVL